MAGVVNAVSNFVGSVTKAASSVLSGVTKEAVGLITPKMPEAQPDAPVAPAANLGPQNTDIQARAVDFATLSQQTSQRASAAGAVRSDNQADLLGLQPVAKRRAASRTLLG